MYNLGLKLWSTNLNYINEAVKLYENNVFNYIELFSVPDSYNKTIKKWKNLKIPFVIHAPHFKTGLDLSDKNNFSKNMNLADEAKKFADELESDIIIFHPGIMGNIEETLYQIKKINDSRIVIENLPYFTIDKKYHCNGYNIEELKYLIDNLNLGFCLDFGHAVFSANANNSDPVKLIDQLLTFNPKIFHLNDGDYSGVVDQHLNLGEGSFLLAKFISKIKTNSLITIETNKKSDKNLKDFIQDIEIFFRYLRK